MSGVILRLSPWLAGLLILAGVGTQAPNYWLVIINNAILAAMGAVALQLLIGYAGQISIGNSAFMALGAWTAGLLSVNLGFVPSIVIGGIVAAAIGFLIGLPALRLAGLYLSLSTLALQVIVQISFTNWESATHREVGIILPIGQVGPWALLSDRVWFVLLALVLATTIQFSWFLLSTKPGRAWIAIREHDTAASIIGVNVTRYKLIAFTFSSFLIGVQGALFAYYSHIASAEVFTLSASISYAVMVLIGGLGSLPGAVVGAFIVSLLPLVVAGAANQLVPGSAPGHFVQRNLPFLSEIAYGLMVLAFLYFEPRGIAGLLRRLTARWPKGVPRAAHE
jgi:branched-chain amino acid transport system permease protein